MKKVYFGFLFLLISIQTYAQSREPKFIELPIDTRPIRFGSNGLNPDDREGIAYGIKADFNLSSFAGNGSFKDGSGYSARFPRHEFLPGYSFGILAEIPIAAKFYVQPELDYSLLGNKLADSAYTQTIKLSYLTLPIVIKFKPFEGFSLFSGLEPDLLLSAKFNSNFKGTAYSGKVNSDFKKFGFSILGGLGYGFNENLGIELRYIRSLANINNTFNGQSYQNSCFQMGLRYFY